MVGELVDVEEEGAGDVVFEVTGVSVDRGRDADGREGGVEDDCRSILKAAGYPG